jgi:glycosyltransferase involved in cell wall biosynthesis
MHILYIQPGSGGSFYCQNCLRDFSACAALRAAGCEVTVLPLYLPATATAPAPDDTPIFYSAVTLYLRHKYLWMRRIPRRWFRLLDSWPVLRLAARLSGSTSAAGLEDLTLSMLKGMEGQQAEELVALAEWIAALPAAGRPDVIILSNALLAGLAGRLKKAANAPVLCWLQDEHVWTDAMHASLRGAVIAAMRADAAMIDRFIAVSEYYRVYMAELLRVPSGHIEVVYPSINTAQYPAPDFGSGVRRIGYLSRISDDDGFGTLVDAFILLRRSERFSDVMLCATGGPSADRNYLKRQMRKLRSVGLEDSVEISPTRFVHDSRGFLSELNILCVPGGDRPAAFGYYALEAMAAGVPVVLPAQGAFPEFIDENSGGVLVQDMTPVGFASALTELLDTPGKLKRLSECAAATARSRFSEKLMAQTVLCAVRMC